MDVALDDIFNSIEVNMLWAFKQGKPGNTSSTCINSNEPMTIQPLKSQVGNFKSLAWEQKDSGKGKHKFKGKGKSPYKGKGVGSRSKGKGKEKARKVSQIKEQHAITWQGVFQRE